jgi:hypothetical protein
LPASPGSAAWRICSPSCPGTAARNCTTPSDRAGLDGDNDNFALWHYVEDGDNPEIQSGELTLIGTFSGNGAIETGNLDLV